MLERDHLLGRVVALGGGRLALGDQGVVLAAQVAELPVGVLGLGRLPRGLARGLLARDRGLVARTRDLLGLGRRGAQGVDVGEQLAQPIVFVATLLGIATRVVACRVERCDAEQLEHEVAPLARPLVAERRQLLLLREDRGAERGVVHPEDRLHEPPRVGDPLGDLEPVGVGLRLHRGVLARDRAPHEVEMALVLELELGEAVGVDTRRADLVLGRARLAPEGPSDGVEQRRLPGPVHAVDPDEPGRQLEVEVVLVDAEVAHVQARDPHESACSTAADR